MKAIDTGRLAVFAGGRTIAAAEAGGTQDSERAVINDLASLLDKSLVRQTDLNGSEPRFGMLETIREFAVDQLIVSGEETETRARHDAFFLALAEEAEPELVGPAAKHWLDRLEADHWRPARRAQPFSQRVSWCSSTRVRSGADRSSFPASRYNAAVIAQ